MIAIVGPTGSGKSTLALRLAHEFDGEIIGCDSLQLYRGFDIGTAKLPAAERAAIPHHLIDILSPDEIFSAGDYGRVARETITSISARGRLPIIVGGTGFYLRALLEGLPDLPGRDENVRARLTRRDRPLHRLLQRLDPAAAARIDRNDKQKLIRALEIRMLTGQPAPAQERSSMLNGYTITMLGLNPNRARLYALLDARTVEMFRQGLIEEVRRLLESGCSGHEKPFESLGYKQALAHLRGNMTLDQAIESTQIETRQYAKRQWTWFRRERDITWLDGFGDETEIVEKARDLVAAAMLR